MRHVQFSGRAAAALLGSLAAFLLAGCGSSEKAIGEVHGVVTHGGKPVTAGVVKFFSEAGGEPVSGSIGPDGSYRAAGVPVGRCKVAVETLAFKNLSAPPKSLAKQINTARPVYVPIPGKYEKPESSGLTAEVKKGDNPLDLPVD